MTSNRGPDPGSARRLWAAAGLYAVTILVSATVVQHLLDALRTRGWLRASILLGFVLAAAAVAWIGWRARLGPAQWVVLAAGAGTVALVASRLDIVQERVHLVQYGLLGGLVWAAWRASRPRDALATAAVAAMAITAGVGLLDEVVQHFVPNRFYDTRDVVLNAVSGAIVVAAAVALARLDRRRGSPRGSDVQ